MSLSFVFLLLQPPTQPLADTKFVAVLLKDIRRSCCEMGAVLLSSVLRSQFIVKTAPVDLWLKQEPLNWAKPEVWGLRKSQLVLSQDKNGPFQPIRGCMAVTSKLKTQSLGLIIHLPSGDNADNDHCCICDHDITVCSICGPERLSKSTSLLSLSRLLGTETSQPDV